MQEILTPREIASREKKKHTFNVAMELFKKYGYEKVTMKMISRESGMSEGSIYYFFGEKAGLLSTLLDEIERSLYSLIEPTEENLRDPKATISRYLCAQAEAYETYGRDIVSVFLSIVDKHYFLDSKSDSFMKVVALSEKDLLDYLTVATEKGYIRCKIDIVEMTFMLTTLGSGILKAWCTYEVGDNVLLSTLQEIYPEVLNQFFTD